MEPKSLETKTLSLAPEAALELRTRTQNRNPEPEPGSRTQNAELESEPGAQRAARSPPPPGAAVPQVGRARYSPGPSRGSPRHAVRRRAAPVYYHRVYLQTAARPCRGSRTW